MNNSLNKVCLLGNLGKEVEVRSMSNGGEVVSFSVATSESWKDKSGVWTDKTEWHKVIIFNEHLIKTAKKLSKGNKSILKGNCKLVSGQTNLELTNIQLKLSSRNMMVD